MLGPVEAVHEGQRVELGRRQERCLLGLLLLEAGRAVPIERLMNLLWSDEPPANARAATHTYLARLRAILGQYDIHLVNRGIGYAIEIDPQRVDVHRFTAAIGHARTLTNPIERVSVLRAALKLWRGPLLADVAAPELRERLDAGLREQRLGALELLAEAELANGNHNAVQNELAELAQEHPTRETFTALLMVALYRSGRQADALEAYRRTRAVLVADLGLEPGPELRQLHQRILRDDPDLAVTPPGRVPLAPARRFLPRDVPDFTGRHRELAVMDTLVGAGRDSAGAVLITTVSGTAGVGKTALAVHWANGAAAHYPDGQLYLNLRGYDRRQPMAPVEALEQLLRALGVPPGRIPFNEDEAAGAYRAALAGKRMLVLLDNAGTVDQVRPLLPSSPGSLALVTSRDRLAGLVARDGARRLDLDLLPMADAVTLLTAVLGQDRVGAEPQAAEDLVAACAYLPLALRIAAADLVDRPGRSLAEHVALLVGGDRLATLELDGDSQSAIRAVFDQSYRSLAAEEQRAFRLVGLVPGADFTAAAVASILDTPPDVVDKLLDRLRDAHLVSEPAVGRYALHDLLRDYAAACSAVEDGEDCQAATLDRLAGWYTRWVDPAVRLLYPEVVRLREPDERDHVFADRETAVAWLDAESRNIVATVVAAGKAGLRASWVLADTSRAYFYARRAPFDLIAMSEATRAAAARDDGRATASHDLAMAQASSMLYQSSEAIAWATSAADHSERHGWWDGHAAILSTLSGAYLAIGKLERAVEYGQQALDVSTRIGRVGGQAVGYARLGLVCLLRGQLAAAIDYQERALALHRTSQDLREQAITLGNLAETYQWLGRTDQALACLREAMSLLAGLGHPHIELITRITFAATYRTAGQLDLALEYARPAYDQLADSPDTMGRGHATATLAAILADQGDLADAVAHYRDAVRLTANLHIRHPETEIRIGFADALRRLGDLTEAAAEAILARDTADRSEYALLAALARTVLAEVRLAERDFDQALVEAATAIAAHQALDYPPGEARAQAVRLTAQAHLG